MARLAMLLLALAGARAGAQAPEFRAFWADAWGEGFQNATQVTQLVADTRAANMNAVVAQVRRRGDAFYNSLYEPKNTGIAAGFDPLGDLLAKAHATAGGPRLEVHAWIVTYHIWNSTTPPTQPTHPFNLHPDWLLEDVNGQTFIGGQYTFDPGHPEVQRHTFNVCLDIVTNYPVDGLNFDYIRYSAPTDGYNPVTVARFNQRFGRSGKPDPYDATWKQFRRDQVTGLLRKVYLCAIAARPEVKISADTITWAPSVTNDAQWFASARAYNDVLQDWRGWMQEGILDLNIPMNYFRHAVASYARDYTNWSNFAKDHRYNRHAVIGPGLYLNSVSSSIVQMRQTRLPTAGGQRADGVCGYSYRSTNTNGVSRATFINALIAPTAYDPVTPPIFSTAVATPAMPWKTAPALGHLKGTVFGGGATNPLDGAVVLLTGPVNRAQTNDATGFYGFVDLPPGNYTVAALFPGYVSGTTHATIVAGVVATRDLTLQTSGPPGIVAQPQDVTVNAGENAAFAVSATGAGPLSWQWRCNGAPLAGATTSALVLTTVATNDAGGYDAVVGNPFGAVTSRVATLTVNLPAPPPGALQVLWSLAPGARPYLTVNSLPYERGLAVNPVTRRLLLVSRLTPAVQVLDSDTGADLHTLSLGAGVVTGGTYPLLLVGVADDGVVYAANLAATASAFRLYRWANDQPGTTPTVAFAGDPAPGTAQRWGDTLGVRGAGTNTQVLLAARNGNLVAFLRTTNGTTFFARSNTVPAAPAGAFGLGLAFGLGDTFWGKATGMALRQVAFDLHAGTGAVARVLGEPDVPNSVSAIGISATSNWLAGVHLATPDALRVYQLPAADAPLAFLGSLPFATDNDNSQAGTGAVDFLGDRVFALDSNNGLLALRLLPRPVFASASLTPEGLVKLVVEGAPQSAFHLDSAAVLGVWNPGPLLTNVTGRAEVFLDPRTNSPVRFFRARL